MPRKPMPWFRLYVETFTDPKVRSLSPAHRWLWTAVLGAARQSPTPGVLLVAEGVPMSVDVLADFAGLSKAETKRGLAALEKLRMVENDDGITSVIRWESRQFESDDVTARTKRHKAKTADRNVPTSFDGTAPENREQRTETEPPPTPSSSTVPNGRGGGAEETRSCHLDDAVARLAQAGGWRSALAARRALAGDGRLDRLTELAGRFPHATGSDLVQLLDGGQLLRRFVDEERAAQEVRSA